MMLNQFIDALPVPALALRNLDGALLHMNRKLSTYLNVNFNDTPLRCRWIDGAHGSCPDDAEHLTIDGRCLFTREESPLILASAFRLMSQGGALLRLYATRETLTSPETIDATRRSYLYALGEPLIPQQGERPRSNRPLVELVQTALNHPHAREVIANIDIPDTVEAPAEGVIPITRLLERLMGEGALLTPKKRLSIRYHNEENLHHRIEMATGRLRLTKGAISLARASHIRLASFANRVAAVTRFPLHPLEYAVERDHVRFSLIYDVTPHVPPPAPLLPAAYKSLSAREQEVAEMIVTGAPPEEIGALLSIKTSTVKQHLKNIYEKTKVRNRLDLLSLIRINE